MRKNIDEFSGKTFDIIIVGGGIYGVVCAWEAVLKGYSVALFERDDFGANASSQSAKIAHSGLRYLQHADFARMRESIRERNHLVRNAPHLVRPQPFLLPVYGHGVKGIEAVSVYMKMFDAFSPDRRSFQDPARRIPGTRIIGRKEVLRIAPDIEPEGLTGGAIWYESQMHNTERLLYSYLRAAELKGAVFYNYCKVERVLTSSNTVTGVHVVDTEGGQSADVRGRVIINATGPWLMEGLGLKSAAFGSTKVHASKAFSLLTRPLSTEYAISFGIKPMYQDEKAVVNKNSSIQFAIPWRGYSLIGSLHLACSDNPDQVTITDDEITQYLERINEGYPRANLKRSDIVNILWGIVPAEKKGSAAPLKHYKIVDHEREDGIAGIISVAGVKYTTSRDVAEKVIKRVEARLSGKSSRSRSARVPLWGGDIDYLDRFHREVSKNNSRYGREVIERLAANYGTRYADILAYAEEDAALAEPVPGTDVLGAEIVHACREEHVVKLADIILRRTDIGSLALPGDDVLTSVAAVAAGELGWDAGRTEREIDGVKRSYLWTPAAAD